MKHSWHQDSGLDDRFTVMLGFPSENLTSLDELKEGVFSHAVRLSHRDVLAKRRGWKRHRVGKLSLRGATRS